VERCGTLLRPQTAKRKALDKDEKFLISEKKEEKRLPTQSALRVIFIVLTSTYGKGLFVAP
jgi:hypothetical protein